MKAILCCTASLCGILLIVSGTNAYLWVTPVTRQPYPPAPDLRNVTPYCFYGPDGRVWPYYNVYPQFPPVRATPPGPIGAGIQEGYLPIELLKNKEAMEATLKHMPMLGKNRQANGHGHAQAQQQQQQQQQHAGPAPYGMSPFGAVPPGVGAPPHYAHARGGPSGPYPVANALGALAPYGPAQMPYMTGAMPYTAMAPGVRPVSTMPYYGGTPYAYPQPMMVRQVMYTPYGPYLTQRPTGIWQVQGVAPNLFPGMGAPVPPAPLNNVIPNPQPGPGWGGSVMQTPGATRAPSGWPNGAGAGAGGGGGMLPPGGSMMLPPGMPTPMPAPAMRPALPYPVNVNPGYSMPNTPYMPMMPRTPPYMPYMPPPPGGAMAPPYGFPTFGPGYGMHFASPYEQYWRPQLPVPPQPPYPSRPQFTQMQMPRMDMLPPPIQPAGGQAFPNHVFVRSPRDFWMWETTMADERSKQGRPMPVP